MNILFVSTKILYPIVDGHSLRTFNLLKEASKDFNIYLLSFIQSDFDLTGVKHLEKFCKDVTVIPVSTMGSKLKFSLILIKSIFSLLPFVAVKYKSRKMEQLIKSKSIDNNIDLIHLDLLPLAQYCTNKINIPTILVEHNIESALLARRMEREAYPAKLFFYLDWLKLRKFEKHALKKVNLTVAVSQKDKEGLKKKSPYAKIEVISNGVDTEYFKKDNTKEEDNTLVYVGGLNWFPNLDAINYFQNDILPIIKKEKPSVKLRVIGRLPGKPLKFVDSAIDLLGFVNDDRPYISNTSIFIVPLRVGGGTRLKILNALSMSKAIVSTSIGCEGLEVTDGTNILIADTAEEFAAKVINLLNSPEKRKSLGESGRRLAIQKYEWNVVAKKMNQLYLRFS